MDLFVVNRYDETADLNDPAKEKRILEKLQRKVEEKKKKKSKVENEVAAPEAPEPMVIDDVEEPELVEGVETVEEEEKPEPIVEEQTKFRILGTDQFEKKKMIDMVLPPWLANPTIISNDLSVPNPINKLYLAKAIKTNLKRLNHESFFPVQSLVIPWIINAQTRPPPFWPRDICVSAPTGSGKTLAFVVPIVHVLHNTNKCRHVRALVVLPVQELANQVFKIFRAIAFNTKVSVALLSTAEKLSTEQKTIVEEVDGKHYSKVDVIVTTAGRLVEHIHATKGFSLKNLRFLVIDEADRVMQEIQNDWLYHINRHVQEESAVLTGRSIPLNINELFNKTGNQPPHKLLFSATLSPDPEKLKTLNLFQPKLFTTAPLDLSEQQKLRLRAIDEVRGDFIGQYTLPIDLKQHYSLVDQKHRPLALYTLIKENNWRKILCFANSKLVAHRLSFILQKLFGKEFIIEELSSLLTPKMRQNVLDQFAKGAVHAVICSDALTRGIDVPNVDVVVSYEPVTSLQTYIHRIGRTARAGNEGTAVTLLADTEVEKFMEVIRPLTSTTIDELKYSTEFSDETTEDYSNSLVALNKALKDEKQLMYVKHSKSKPSQLGGMSLLEKLQANLPSAGETLRTAKTTSKQQKSNLPQSWNTNALLDNNEESANSKKKDKKLKRKNNLKKKFEKLVQ